MIGVRMRDINGGRVFLRFENLRGEAMGFTETELRVDDQHVLFAEIIVEFTSYPFAPVPVWTFNWSFNCALAVAASAMAPQWRPATIRPIMERLYRW